VRILVTAAVAAAALAGLSAFAGSRVEPRILRVSVAGSASAGVDPGLSAACPPGTLPDEGACIPVPEGAQQGGLALPEEQNAHRDRQGRWQEYDHIPRLPERPEDYRQYRLPVPAPAEQSFVTSGYDLHLPDAEQRRGADLHAVGHGGIDIAQKRGTEVRLVPLEHQDGDATVLYVGPLFGNTVVTRHVVREGGVRREYVVLLGHLERAASTIARGTVLKAGEVLGYVGDSGSPGAVHLHYEARRVREGFEAMKLETGELTRNARTVACDPRNVLPLQ
jgi:murein DD-endopeptidase MepM/ murein hydrolase activator NlpD